MAPTKPSEPKTKTGIMVLLTWTFNETLCLSLFLFWGKIPILKSPLIHQVLHASCNNWLLLSMTTLCHRNAFIPSGSYLTFTAFIPSGSYLTFTAFIPSGSYLIFTAFIPFGSCV
ncbi:hypothetical protein SLEP1_g18007 [Rubroshorea leprosula]|uniref:Uncharacterized protein n=1 Tax=Rubroshorea leprosula TaxID=152421 RepID=A0AAV5J571_9ROSI|nr:hypothetical protein SLEP1_g18007 [Rubroshorea leprosula]